MKKHANICGNALLNIIHSFDYERPFESNLPAKISSEWDPDLDTLDELKYKLPNKAVQGDPFNSNEDHHNVLQEGNRMSYANVKSILNKHFIKYPLDAIIFP